MANKGEYQDLEERTYKFAERVREYVKKLTRSISHIEYGKQLIRSSGSVAANYIETNESISKKDFYHRIKICRKEAKESRLWIRLTTPTTPEQSEQKNLEQESMELMKIFNAIVANHEKE